MTFTNYESCFNCFFIRRKFVFHYTIISNQVSGASGEVSEIDFVRLAYSVFKGRSILMLLLVDILVGITR